MKKNIICKVCENTKHDIIRKRLRHDVKRNVLKCKKCGLVFLEPKAENLHEYYAHEYRKTYSPEVGKSNTSKEIFKMYAPVQESRFKQVKKYLGKNKRVLDIGCSAGHFLNKIQSHVKECVGLEFNVENARYVKRTLGVDVYTKPIEETDIPDKYFDVVFCLQTFEHIENPLYFLQNVHRILKDNGVIYFEVPNLKEATLSIYHNQGYEDFYYRNPHLFYYTPETLKRMMANGKFVGEVKPFQWYNFVNQMHWLQTNGPQPNGFDGLKDPVLVENKTVPAGIKNDINTWIKKVDQEYKKLLEKHNISDQIVFVGKKK